MSLIINHRFAYTACGFSSIYILSFNRSAHPTQTCSTLIIKGLYDGRIWQTHIIAANRISYSPDESDNFVYSTESLLTVMQSWLIARDRRIRVDIAIIFICDIDVECWLAAKGRLGPSQIGTWGIWASPELLDDTHTLSNVSDDSTSFNGSLYLTIIVRERHVEAEYANWRRRFHAVRGDWGFEEDIALRANE